MTWYIIKRIFWAVLTVFLVMLLTFVLLRLIPGDVSSAYVNQKLGMEARMAFYEKHKLNRPNFFNLHNRLILTDFTKGPGFFTISDSGSSRLAKNLALRISNNKANTGGLTRSSHLIKNLSGNTSLTEMGLGAPPFDTSVTSKGYLLFQLNDSSRFTLDLSTINHCKDLISAINTHPVNQGKVKASTPKKQFSDYFDAQFIWHLYENITFTGKSYATDQTVFAIIRERGKFSLAITIPAMALGWFIAMIISCLVAYYRDGLIDKLGVFLAVLGMCIPYLAYMLLGQWLMFKLFPSVAIGLSHPMSIYVPVSISVIAGLGWSVRFYRTVILDQVNTDYVRTARAKGVSVSGILFKHVLKNSMLPILTNLVATIPFLIMGSLLLERFFAIPGLGDLMLTSITSRDIPIITGLTFLTAVLYVFSLLITDILYAVFDPRIRLQ